MGNIIDVPFINKNRINGSKIWISFGIPGWSELFLSSAISIKKTIDLVSVYKLCQRLDIMKFTKDVLMDRINEVFAHEVLFDFSHIKNNDEECRWLIPEKDLMVDFSDYDAEQILRGFYVDRDIEFMMHEAEQRNRLVLEIPEQENAYTECYSRYNVIGLIPSQNSDAKSRFVTIKNPVFHSVLLMTLSVRRILYACTEEPDDPVSTSPEISSMKKLLATIAGSGYYHPAFVSYQLEQDDVQNIIIDI